MKNSKQDTKQKSVTFMLNSSAESHAPIFKNGVKAGAAAEPNSKADASKGSNCKSRYMLHKRFHIIILLKLQT